MRLKRIINMFKQGNVCVTGLRGTGKDLLTGNVIVRRKKPYVSNLDYTSKKNYQRLDFNKLDCGCNSYTQFITGKVNKYTFPYVYSSDVYISDAGIYLPSQYNNFLNRDYPHLPTYFALSRQISDNNVHINVQNLNRVWDKLREQSDTYICCNKCFYLKRFKLVFQIITIYNKAQSCIDRVNPCRVPLSMLGNASSRMQARIYRDNFYNTHGKVKRTLLIYFNKSKHDTLYFGNLLEEKYEESR